MTTPHPMKDGTAETGSPQHQQDPASGAAVRVSRQGSKKAPSAFRTISEVADELKVQQHVLRFWETKFTQIKPLKRGGGRRYYRPEDVALLKRIHALLYTEGYTIKGVQKLLKGGQGRQPTSPAPSSSETASSQQPQAASQSRPSAHQVPPAAAAISGEPRPGMSDRQRVILNAMLGELKDLRDLLKKEIE